MKRGYSLRIRLTASVVVIVVMLAGAIAAVLPGRLAALSREGMNRRGEAMAMMLASSLSASVDFGDADEASVHLAHVEGAHDVAWSAVWTVDGTRMAAWGPAPPAPPPLGISESEDAAVFVRTVEAPSGRVGRAAVSLSLAGLHQQEQEGLATILLVAMVLIVAAGVATWLVSEQLILPVRTLIGAARRVADGHLEVHALGLVADPSWRDDADETRQLTLAVSDMATLLARRLSQIGEERERAREAERVAVEASRAKSSFLANMSHELRTPLNAIIGYSEMVSEDLVEQGSDLLDDVTKIHRSGSSLLALINDLLDLAKIEAGQMETELAPVRIDELVRDAVMVVQPAAQKGQNEIRVELDPTVVSIHSDATRLRQILLNLLSNAAKFTKGGVITVSTHRSGGEVHLGVRDTGIGIAPAQINRMFLPFHQADSSTTKRFGGTGLGLALVRQFVELLGGAVQASSAPGEGSLFTIRLPLQPLPDACGDATLHGGR